MTFTSTTPCRLHSLWQELCSHPYARWRADAICRGCRPEDLPQRLHQDDAAALRALIAARNGATSEFAGMALIQAILPTLVMIASRDRQACLDDYIGEAWMVITNFPLSRTNKVCTNVALDCLHAISSRRQRSSPETPSESIDISAPEVQEPGRVASDMLSAAEKLGIITPASAPVLRSVWVDALDCATAAQRHNTSPTAVRARCSRASRAMRQHRDELLAAS
ncbi:hypothetical protein E5345_09295 [Propionibacterium sp. NM47_B9-13]|jgi:hypothetical protein|uniref:Uncharacterized protein n=1 Tax=Cutibacterium modestum HL044PA1 TaxID=765109 RepID=A0ABP2K7M0_9ACTN|nr:hypothetical protein [Cutibacterium modestum]TGY28262.1 hypothetical protein E5345_09295 [Propionibacterium sp. NM47_B9-13]EFS72829.1 hypothetical protein HMPREF9621_02731 [Cutibacterium modestum HL037PA2]EFS92923.1 hypothetical protein HMPREF9607_00773 [Cutibacterium modestum HL044PA1]EFT14909.1 hypothetical protein HMPREF9622_02031 [Cutibacterium modestum HL037PA3]EGG25613.1 hypothetical protein PA08_2564 [Cutibacterium modestum P08]